MLYKKSDKKIQSELIRKIIAMLEGAQEVSNNTIILNHVKLMLEEARLSMTDNPANQTALHLAFAQERAEEMAGLAELDRAPTRAHLANYQLHWREGLQRAGDLGDEDLQGVMKQARTMAGVQETLLAHAQSGVRSQIQTRLREATKSLEKVQTAVALGLQSQNTYRWRISDGGNSCLSKRISQREW